MSFCSWVRTLPLSAPYASVSFRSLRIRWLVGQRRRRLGPELRSALEQERAHRGEPRRLYCHGQAAVADRPGRIGPVLP